MKQQHAWTAVWTGCYPTHCYGEWELYKDGEPVDLEAAGCPFIHDHANTYGEYPHWEFDDDLNEDWYFWYHGLGQRKWCKENAHWLRKLNAPFDWTAIYRAFRAKDWRYGCCGGCI